MGFFRDGCLVSFLQGNPAAIGGRLLYLLIVLLHRIPPQTTTLWYFISLLSTILYSVDTYLSIYPPTYLPYSLLHSTDLSRRVDAAVVYIYFTLALI